MLDCLVIAPHPDDAELGVGGTILRMLDQGMKVGVLDLTNGEPTPHGTVELRAKETAEATRVLGLPWRENLGLPNRKLEATLENRAKLAGVFRRARPRWLFAPYWVDAHPDHVAATQLVEDARFWSKLTKSDLPGEPFHPQHVFYYYCVHLRVLATPAFVVDITPYWERKRKAIECYQSQFVTGREQESPPMIDRLRDQAAYWGWSIGKAYGEPIFSREPLGLSGFGEII
ncbi:MAG TPA: bacillithiol biosynthesis deacetylase BshB1 [Pirellulales bacterium]|jgi:bacillithiol biosynthesis deacetylase BshB1|nr:bacillithiol biosynthesis deacetylase BshB1 [Pirellulales bacterium]